MNWQKRLLMHLSTAASHGSERKAAPRTRVDGKTVRTFKRLDPTFAQAIATAKLEAARERVVARYHADPSFEAAVAVLALSSPEWAALERKRNRKPRITAASPPPSKLRQLAAKAGVPLT
jgi:hypothetical protein